jgi:hypothetical protein
MCTLKGKSWFWEWGLFSVCESVIEWDLFFVICLIFWTRSILVTYLLYSLSSNWIWFNFVIWELFASPSYYMVLLSLKLFGRRRNYMGFIILMILPIWLVSILSQLWCAGCKILFCRAMLSWIFNRSACFVELNEQSVSSLKSLTQNGSCWIGCIVLNAVVTTNALLLLSCFKLEKVPPTIM